MMIRLKYIVDNLLRVCVVLLCSVCFALDIHAQVLDAVPVQVLNRQMKMDAPLPSPSFDIAETTVNIHFLNWDMHKAPALAVNMVVTNLFPKTDTLTWSRISKDGHASIRFRQLGTSSAVINMANLYYSKLFYLWPGETAEIYIDLDRMKEAGVEYTKIKQEARCNR